MMKAMVCTKYGAPDVFQLQEVEKPIPRNDEVVIKVHAITATTASAIGRIGKPYFVRFFFGLTKLILAMVVINLAMLPYPIWYWVFMAALLPIAALGGPKPAAQLAGS